MAGASRGAHGGAHHWIAVADGHALVRTNFFGRGRGIGRSSLSVLHISWQRDRVGYGFGKTSLEGLHHRGGPAAYAQGLSGSAVLGTIRCCDLVCPYRGCEATRNLCGYWK